jgi:hypothetical protein
MPVDPETAKYAENRFNQRLEDEIRPAYRERLSEVVARWNPTPQLLFSGSQAQIFIAVEARYARCVTFTVTTPEEFETFRETMAGLRPEGSVNMPIVGAYQMTASGYAKYADKIRALRVLAS